MRKVFADTSYWMALINPRDQLHAKAVAVTRRLCAAHLVTTEMVFVELLNSFSDSPFRTAVAALVERITQTPNVTVVPQTPTQFVNAVRRYRSAADKQWSVTDCASFDVMQMEYIEAALTHDRHFVQAGFEALLRT